MTAIVDKKIFMFLMGLCLCMQVLALMPHHHHGEGAEPCINIIHCVGMTASHDCDPDAARQPLDEKDKASDHTHGTKNDTCSVNDRNILRVDREDVRSSLLSNNDILLYAVFVVGSDDDSCGHCYLDSILELNIKKNPGVQPVHTSYIAVAMPPRAPSFTA